LHQLKNGVVIKGFKVLLCFAVFVLGFVGDDFV